MDFFVGTISAVIVGIIVGIILFHYKKSSHAHTKNKDQSSQIIKNQYIISIENPSKYKNVQHNRRLYKKLDLIYLSDIIKIYT